ncbi:MAG: peptidoglycan DD-metalloendopeptidase family protein [Bdellovibrionota bacterium]
MILKNDTRSGVTGFIKRNKLTSLFSFSLLIQLTVFAAGFFMLQDLNTPQEVQLAIATETVPAKTVIAKPAVTESIDARASLAINNVSTKADKTKSLAAKTQNPKKSQPTAVAKIIKEKPSTSDNVLINYEVRSGDTLSQIWNNNGGTYKGAIAAANAFKKAGVSLNTLRPGETVRIKSNDGEVQKFVKRLPGAKILTLTLNPDESYDFKLNEPNIIEAEKKVSGVILNSFAESAHRVSLPSELIDDFVDLFGGRVEFSRNIQPGDVFTVVYTEKRNPRGRVLGIGSIKIASLVNSGEMIAAVRHIDTQGESRFYDENGEPLGNFFLRYPLRFTRISSQFSHSRFHPVLKKHRPHNGVDFAAPTGTPVRSVAEGIVQTAGWNGGAGRMVKIKHSDRWSTAYLHLNSISKGIRNGTRVKRGEIIGTVGSTGLATGPHLHFSMYDNGRYVDPMNTELPKMPNEKEVIPAAFLRATLKMLEKEQEILHLASLAEASNIG